MAKPTINQDIKAIKKELKDLKQSTSKINQKLDKLKAPFYIVIIFWVLFIFYCVLVLIEAYLVMSGDIGNTVFALALISIDIPLILFILTIYDNGTLLPQLDTLNKSK